MRLVQHHQVLENLSQKLLYSLGRTAVCAYARLMLRLDVDWQAPLPPEPKLIVANHPSISDPIYLALLSPQPIKILIIDNPFAVPVLGTYLRGSGHIPVVPGDGRAAFQKAQTKSQQTRPRESVLRSHFLFLL